MPLHCRARLLPPRVVAGAQATLAVVDSHGRLLPNVTVELSTGQNVTTDVTGRALFKAPEKPGKLDAKIFGQRGPSPAFTSVVASKEDSATSRLLEGNKREAVQVVSYPHASWPSMTDLPWKAPAFEARRIRIAFP